MLETGGRHECRAGSFPLQDRVRRNRGAMGHARRAQVLHPLDDRLLRIGRARQLCRHDVAATKPNEVGEGAADIHSDVHDGGWRWRLMSLTRVDWDLAPLMTFRIEEKKEELAPGDGADLLPVFSCSSGCPPRTGGSLRGPAGRGRCS